MVIICFWGISNFIWNIEITGISEEKQKEIISFLKSEQIEIGKLKIQIDVASLTNKLRIEREI